MPTMQADGVIPYDREALVWVTIFHGRDSIKGCYCGWAELGKSHAEHVANVYEEQVLAKHPVPPDPASSVGGVRIYCGTHLCNCPTCVANCPKCSHLR